MKRRTPPAPQLRTGTKYIPYDDWTALTGGTVEIRLNSCVVQRGVVDRAIPDSSALWLRCTQGGNRRYFSKEEG
jgi:hypothetical protein